jgi:hypothetical protein
VASVEDVNLDMYARSKQQLKAIEEADRVLAEEEARKKRRNL